MDKKNSILYGNGRLKNIRKNINLYTVLVKPNFGCSTKAIYGNVRNKPLSHEGHDEEQEISEPVLLNQ